VKDADLVVVNEGGRFLLNYLLLLKQKSRLAFWGHGGNLDSDASPVAEAVKARMYRLPHWWFAYTEGSRQRVEKTGFPRSRITVVQNAASTEELRRMVGEASQDDRTALRNELGLGEGPVGLYLGSLYAAKRVEFLIEACEQVVAARPDFRLVIAGDGPDRERLSALVEGRTHVHMVGRVDGRMKAGLLSISSMLLLPGAIGLSVTDGFAAGIPTVTVADAWHRPEYEYITSGLNGHVVRPNASPREYGDAILRLLNDSEYGRLLARGAAESADRYTLAAMVDRFAAGIELALGRDAPVGAG
jgi:glycosyltransferase involved in cell wall biosynthesis